MPYWVYMVKGSEFIPLKSFNDFSEAQCYAFNEYDSWKFNCGIKMEFAIFYGNERIS